MAAEDFTADEWEQICKDLQSMEESVQDRCEEIVILSEAYSRFVGAHQRKPLNIIDAIVVVSREISFFADMRDRLRASVCKSTSPKPSGG